MKLRYWRCRYSVGLGSRTAILVLSLIDILLVAFGILFYLKFFREQLGTIAGGATVTVSAVPVHLAARELIRAVHMMRIKSEHTASTLTPTLPLESSSMNFRPSRPFTVRTLLSRTELYQVIGAMKARIGEDYRDRDLLVVGILEGAKEFVGTLQHGLKLPASVEPLTAFAFDDAQNIRRVCLATDFIAFLRGEEPTFRHGSAAADALVRGKHVLLVDDMVISGSSLWEATKLFRSLGAASVESAVLVEKRGELRQEYSTVRPKYVGVTVHPAASIVGFGMDWAKQFRNEPGLCQLIRSSDDESLDVGLKIVVPGFRPKERKGSR